LTEALVAPVEDEVARETEVAGEDEATARGEDEDLATVSMVVDEAADRLDDKDVAWMTEVAAAREDDPVLAATGLTAGEVLSDSQTSS
jgi:hypothetical protein